MHSLRGDKVATVYGVKYCTLVGTVCTTYVQISNSFMIVWNTPVSDLIPDTDVSTLSTDPMWQNRAGEFHGSPWKILLHVCNATSLH